MRHKRTLKKFFSAKGRATQLKKIDLNKLLTGLALLSVLTFIVVQLMTNAILSPLGHRLQALNVEKNQLVEENRILEQEIAKSNSVIVIETYSKDKLKLRPGVEKNTVFVNNESVQAINVE